MTFSCFQTYTILKPIIKKPKSTNNTIIQALLYKYFDLLYSKASKRQRISKKKQKDLIRLSLLTFSHKKSLAFAFFKSIPRGLYYLVPKNQTVKNIIRASTGRLIKKCLSQINNKLSK